jgi:hypothetical protein
MTKAQIKAFEELIANGDFRGRKELKHLLWLNTTTPKYNVGDCFLVTDYAHRIYGHQVVNFKAKIVKISTWRDTNEYFYHLEMICKCNGKTITSPANAYESELRTKCADNVNILGEAKSKLEDACEVAL